MKKNYREYIIRTASMERTAYANFMIAIGGAGDSQEQIIEKAKKNPSALIKYLGEGHVKNIAIELIEAAQEAGVKANNLKNYIMVNAPKLLPTGLKGKLFLMALAMVVQFYLDKNGISNPIQDIDDAIRQFDVNSVSEVIK